MTHLIRIILPILLVFLAYQTLGKTQRNDKRLNRLINAYLNASHVYLNMGVMLNNMDSDVPSLKTFLRKQSDEKRDWAFELIEYQYMRGDGVRIMPIIFRERDHLDIGEASVSMEMRMKADLLDMPHEDVELAYHLMPYLERHTEIISEIRQIRKFLKGKRCFMPKG